VTPAQNRITRRVSRDRRPAGEPQLTDWLEPPYAVRFIASRDSVELVNLYHLARGVAGNDRHERKVKAAQWFHDEHPEVSATAAYKDLDGLLA
jgi:hypothetical protein